MLLNLDYSGQGEHFSNFVSPTQRYGILQATDAVWIKRLQNLAEQAKPNEFYSFVNFLFLNNAPDLAFYMLKEFNSNFLKRASDKNLDFCKILTIKQPRSLKWIPNQSEEVCSDFFRNVLLKSIRQQISLMNCFVLIQ